MDFGKGLSLAIAGDTEKVRKHAARVRYYAMKRFGREPETVIWFPHDIDFGELCPRVVFSPQSGAFVRVTFNYLGYHDGGKLAWRTVSTIIN